LSFVRVVIADIGTVVETQEDLQQHGQKKTGSGSAANRAQ